MLRLAGINKTYNGRLILNNVSLHIAPGTLTLVTGSNGAGKSTLLHIMAGLLRPDSGTVESTTPAGKTGFLGHETLLYPNLTALENLAFWSTLHKKDTDETALLATLDRMNLAPFADGMAGGFSRGMAQRLSLARLLLLSPSLVLLDEPLTGLDADSATLVKTELLRLRENGASLVWVTHSPEQDGETADGILHLAGKGVYEYRPTVSAAQGQQDCDQAALAAREGRPGADPKGLFPLGEALRESRAELAQGQLGCPQQDYKKTQDCDQAAPAVREKGMLSAAATLAAKDIRTLAGRGNVLLQSILLGLLLIVLFSLSFDGAQKAGPTAAATIFWLASAFCLTILATSLFMMEETALARKGLLLSPHPAQFIWLGKTLALVGLLLIIQAVFFLASLVFLDLSVSGNAILAVSGVFLVNIGAAALSSLLASFCRGQAARESLASILVFPLLVPLLLAGIRLLAAGYGETGIAAPLGDAPNDASSWLGIAAAFDAIFIAVALTLFPVTYGGEN